MIDYAKLGIIAAVSAFIFGSGWWIGYSKYIDFKKEVEMATKAQEAHVESIKKQQELVTKGITNEYEAKLAAVRNYYKSTSVWNNSPSKVSGFSATPSATDVITAYNQLASACAETTQQLISIQDWIREQAGIK